MESVELKLRNELAVNWHKCTPTQSLVQRQQEPPVNISECCEPIHHGCTYPVLKKKIFWNFSRLKISSTQYKNQNPGNLEYFQNAACKQICLYKLIFAQVMYGASLLLEWIDFLTFAKIQFRKHFVHCFRMSTLLQDGRGPPTPIR